MAAALAALASRSTGGLGAGLGFGLGAGSLATAMVEVVVSAAAAGAAGLAPSRPTTRAVATPMATASTPATAARRIWDGRIATPRSTLPHGAVGPRVARSGHETRSAPSRTRPRTVSGWRRFG